MRWTRTLLTFALAAAPFAPASAQRAPVAPTPATPTPAAQPAARPCPDCDSVDRAADKMRAQEETQRAEMERLYYQAIDAREAMKEQNDSSSRVAYEHALKAYNESRAAYSLTVRQHMRTEMERAQREMDREMARVRARQGTLPAGWLGVYFSGEMDVSKKDGRDLVRWTKYPIIESVEPDCPAEKAGVESRDLLIAIDGQDVTKVPIDFHEILVPGRHVTLKVKHGRTMVDRLVVVEKRPRTAWSSGSGSSYATPVPREPAEAPDAPEPPEPPEPPEQAWRSPLPPPTRFAPLAPGAVTVNVWYDNMTIAGARVQQVNPLKDYFGVDSGVLVLSVETGTPAERAGLRDGDVIIKANGKSVPDPMHLSQVLSQTRGGAVSLEIVRQKKKQTVVLK